MFMLYLVREDQFKTIKVYSDKRKLSGRGKRLNTLLSFDHAAQGVCTPQYFGKTKVVASKM